MDEPRIRVGERIAIEPELSHTTRYGGFDQEVRGAREPDQLFAPRGSREVEHEAALSARERPERERALGAGLVLPEGRPRAQRASTRGLDQHHVGAQVREDLPAQRPEVAAEIENAQAVQHGPILR